MSNYIKNKDNIQNYFLIISLVYTVLCFEEFCVYYHCVIEMLYDGVLLASLPTYAANSVMLVA